MFYSSIITLTCLRLISHALSLLQFINFFNLESTLCMHILIIFDRQRQGRPEVNRRPGRDFHFRRPPANKRTSSIF